MRRIWAVTQALIMAAWLIILMVLLLCEQAQAKNVRSTAVKNAFVKLQACPATALNKLPCTGFVIDDKKSLDCGGTDTVDNKQWLTIAAAKAKDRYERNGEECAHRTHGTPP